MLIFKYKVTPEARYIGLPSGYQILSAGVQDESIFVWALIDETSDVQHKVEICVYGTGHEINSDKAAFLRFIGTVFLDSLVFHVFENLETFGN